ncbi:hypothetical protein [Blastopirellula marina]|uniref:Uncharacterized protein n=1 Tax=Blastopirellula marina DSM 3645 TaxID=314230 RepID=A3ZUZ5_9BACT|nr:hypothetical protein [Blastopirellula marina]EAQ79731.1 hypothetical protein DSM3645_24520 [Blastopirellula marina DSM 3645]
MISTAKTLEPESLERNRTYRISAVKQILGATSKPSWGRVLRMKLGDGTKIADHILGSRTKFLEGAIVIDAMKNEAATRRNSTASASV